MTVLTFCTPDTETYSVSADMKVFNNGGTSNKRYDLRLGIESKGCVLQSDCALGI